MSISRNPPRHRLMGAAVAALCAATAMLAFQAKSSGGGAPPGDEYTKEVRPLLQRHCWKCHSGDRQEAEVDLESFATLADIRKAPKTWQKVLEMLDSGQMPPKTAKQPSDADRTRLTSWTRAHLKAEAKALAGDPGPVVLRRLSNAEYTFSVRDLTGVPSLDPAKQFPVDGAAGEGFTNAGQALVMSPALLAKYLDAGKDIADHLVLLPDGIRFSPGTGRRDWTNEALANIRELYRKHSDSQGGTRVNLQGIVFDTNDGGRLPVEKYLAATLAEREAFRSGSKSFETVARERGLNAKYLASLWGVLNDRGEPSPLLDGIRAKWRDAKPEGAGALASEIASWQKALTKFQSVGHMKSWMAPVNPTTARQELRVKLAPPPSNGKEIVLYLVSGDAGDGAADDFVLWLQPRILIPGRPDVPLRDVRAFVNEMTAVRQRTFDATIKCLRAAAEAGSRPDTTPVAQLAKRHEVDAELLAAWFEYLGIGAVKALKVEHFTNKLNGVGGYDFVRGWGSPETPSLVANSSDRHVRIPGNMKGHGVCVHPSPTLQTAVGWTSPISATVRVEAKVTHAHPECGNGVAWSLELRRGTTRQRLAAGVAHGAKAVPVGPFENLRVRKGDLLSLLIGPRDGNHSCDLTDIELAIRSKEDESREWSLTKDVTAEVHAGNPHADRFGNAGVWHFYTEPVAAGDSGHVIPSGSLLARWLEAETADQKGKISEEIQTLLTKGPTGDANAPNAVLYRHLTSPGGPLFAKVRPKATAAEASRPVSGSAGLDPASFGKHPDGTIIDSTNLCVKAPSILEVRLPAELFAGSEFVATGVLHKSGGNEGSVQLRALTSKPATATGLLADVPILVGESGPARQRWESGFNEFRQWFPAALCYTKIVPVDEVVTLTLFHREDEPLCRLMLDEKEKARLDKLWEELHFVTHDAITLVDAFNQLMEYATQDSNPKLFEPFRQPILDRAAAFRKALLDAEPRHLDAVVEFAARAYRRPLTDGEAKQLRDLYRALRKEDLKHDDAIRLTLARALTSPAFLYRLEKAPAGPHATAVSDLELATRLSYFLWSSTPDAELRELALAGRLHDPAILAGQARRMLRDGRVRRLAAEFACQWLHIYNFDTLDEKSERHFPTFVALRGDIYEEAIRFFTDLFQSDASVLSVFDANHTFVDEALAKHYGIQGVSGPEWRRVDNVRQYGRGGVLGLAATLAKQSGASRTSPILRGNWVCEVLLGEKLPRPPKDVPRLPDDEKETQGLTVRQLVEKHSSDPRCAVCHTRIDPFGHALEGFDAIGRRRDKDLGERSIDTHVKLKDGSEFDGLAGLRDYLLTKRRDDILRQFCKKLLGYALGRGIQLSDELLLEEMQEVLKKNDYRVSSAVETIVRSRQFREIRGRDFE